MEMTYSGLPVVGALPWGSHFCHFYTTPDDRADCLVPYFKAGIDRGEACFWITTPPFNTENASAALRTAVPDLSDRMARGQIEIVDVRDYYRRSGEIDPDGILGNLLERKDRALARGYAGLRANGNTCWIESRQEWRNLAEYEEKVNACFHSHRILGFCSYQLDRCEATDTIEVVRNHQFTLLRQHGEWEMIESASLKAAKEALRKANATLEQRVAERTTQLAEGERHFHELLEALPAAVYTTDAAGRITYCNQAAAELAGRRPALGTDEWCVTWRLYWPDGRPMPHAECPMAVALKENRPIRGEEAVAERPDGRRVPFLPYPTPLYDASGALIGAVNMLVDISERKQAEEAMRQSLEELRSRTEELTRFNRAAVGRELRMIELKKEVNELRRH